MACAHWVQLFPDVWSRRSCCDRWHFFDRRVVFGAAAYNIYSRSSLGVLASLGALSVLFRVYAASDAVRITQSRRARLGLN